MSTKKILADLDLRGKIEATGAVSGSNLSGTNTGDQDLSGLMIRGTNFAGDCDTLFAQGTYRINSSATNAPTASFYSMIVSGNGGNVTSQTAVHFTSGASYVRAYNTAWSSWRETSGTNTGDQTLTGLNYATTAQGVLADNSVQLTGETYQIVEGRLGLYDQGNNVYVGRDAGASENNSDNRNVGIGYNALKNNVSGIYNSAGGFSSMINNTTGFRNSAFGMYSLKENTTGYYNSAFGFQAGNFDSAGNLNTTSNNSLYLGFNTTPLASGGSNETVIGANAAGKGSNTVVIGKNNVTDTYLHGGVSVLRNFASYAVNLTDTNNRHSLKLKSSTSGDGHLTVSQGDASEQLIQGSSSGNASVPVNINPFGGFVGVNKINPEEALDVNGTVQAEEYVNVNSSNQEVLLGGGNTLKNIVLTNSFRKKILTGNSFSVGDYWDVATISLTEIVNLLSVNLTVAGSGTGFSSEAKFKTFYASPSAFTFGSEILPYARNKQTHTFRVAIEVTQAVAKIRLYLTELGTNGNVAYDINVTINDISTEKGSTIATITGLTSTGNVSLPTATQPYYFGEGTKVGFGTEPAYDVDVLGEGRFTGDLRALSFITTSQSDTKRDIVPISKTTGEKILFKSFKYKSEIDGSNRKRYGVLAEDIQEEYPELVHVGADGKLGVNYVDLLIKRVAELEQELEDASGGATITQTVVISEKGATKNLIFVNGLLQEDGKK
jgi:hypothetical protein